MGENAVPHKCGKNSYPETDQLKNLLTFTVIPHNLYYKGFFSKELAKNRIFCEFFH